MGIHIFKFYDAKASSTSSLSSSSKVVSFLSNTNSITAATNKIAGITEYAWITENFEANAYRYPYDLPAIKVANVHTPISTDTILFGAYLATNEFPSGEKNISPTLRSKPKAYQELVLELYKS